MIHWCPWCRADQETEYVQFGKLLEDHVVEHVCLKCRMAIYRVEVAAREEKKK